MKTVGSILVLALSLGPLMARGQSDPKPAMMDSGEPPSQVVIAQQSQSETLAPPPGPVVIRRIGGMAEGPGPIIISPEVNRAFSPKLGAWWKNSEIVSKLQLSQEQVKNISETFLNHRLKLIDLQADVEKQELRLEPLLDIDQPDESRVSEQIDLITAARGRLEKENAMMMLDIRRWLSAEQWKKLKAMQGADEGRQNFFFIQKGTGGPLPPPMPGDFPVMPPAPPQPPRQP